MAEVTEPVIGDPADPGAGGGGGGGTGVGTIIFDVAFFKQQAESVLRVLVYANLVSGDDLQLTGYLTIDGYVRQTCSVNLILDQTNSAAKSPMTFPLFQTGLAVGAHRIVFSIANREPDSALTIPAGATIEITELKQAAL